MTTYTKLRDGSWGLRGKNLTSGQTVTVTTKAGKSKTECVGKVLWTGPDGLSLATIADGGGRRKCKGCGKAEGTPMHCAPPLKLRRDGYCWDCASDD